MFPILFTRQDFLHLRHLKYLLTNISIKIHFLNQQFEILNNFVSEYEVKIENFLDYYDQLYKEIRPISLDIKYFTNELAILGHKCLKIYDEIGLFLDFHIQNLPLYLKKHFDCIMDTFY